MSKVDFKHPYDFRKLSRYNPDSSICDLLSEDVYFGLRYTKDNITKTTTQLYDNSIGVLVKDKKQRYQFLTVTATMGAGFLTALTFNLLGADYAHSMDYTAEKISSHSFKFETIAHAAFSGITFMTLSTRKYMKEGNTFWKSVHLSGKDLAVLTAVATPIALKGYNYFRGVLVTHDIVNGIDPKWAVFWAQLKLVGPYYISVLTTHKVARYFTDKIGFTKKVVPNGIVKKELDDKIISSVDRIDTKSIDNIIDTTS